MRHDVDLPGGVPVRLGGVRPARRGRSRRWRRTGRCRPSRSSAPVISPATPSSLAASPGSASPPQDPATSRAAPASMSLTTTLAPSAANRRASAAPMPLPAPVITTPAPRHRLHSPGPDRPALTGPGPPGPALHRGRSARRRGRGQGGQAGQGGPVPVRGAERDRRARGPLQVQVRGVLPGEADTPVQLHAFLGCQGGGVPAGRLGQGDRDRGVRVVVGQAGGGVPGRGPGLADGHPQVRGAVLQRLERADRAGELVPLLQVGDGHLQAALSHPQLLGGQHRGPGGQRGDYGAVRVRAGGQRPGGHAVQGQVGQRAGLVQRDHRGDGQPGRAGVHRVQPGGHAVGRDEQHRGGQGVGHAA